MIKIVRFKILFQQIFDLYKVKWLIDIETSSRLYCQGTSACKNSLTAHSYLYAQVAMGHCHHFLLLIGGFFAAFLYFFTTINLFKLS